MCPVEFTIEGKVHNHEIRDGGGRHGGNRDKLETSRIVDRLELIGMDAQVFLGR